MSDQIKCDGEVIKVFPGAKFLVRLDNDMEITAHLAGKIRKHYIRIMVGDIVTVEISPYDLTKGRIVYRK